MRLIIGGAFQGKTKFAQEYLKLNNGMIDGIDCSTEEIFTCKVINHFHEYIRRALERGEECNDLADELIKRNPDCVIIVDELGCGVVPTEPFERLLRERSGRVCTELAEYATDVYRVVSGIGQVIKGA